MAKRYAVLWEQDADRSLPVGIVVQHEDHVFVDVRDELCVPKRYDDPFVVGSVNEPVAITYQPGDPQYFDQVLIDLSRTFTVGEQGTVASTSGPTVERLLRDKVLAPIRKLQPVQYVRDAGQYETIRAYRRRYYSDAAVRATAEPEPPAAARAVQGSVVAA